MSGVQIRNFGSTAAFAPDMKRAIATLTDGRSVAVVIDSNLASSGGTDVTGVAKIHLYVSNDATRLTWTLATSYTPPLPPSSSTKAGLCAMSVGSDNSIWVAWRDTSDGLNVTKWTYSAGTVTFSANTVVFTAGGITNRIRAIDIDVTGTANVLVGTYEADASTSNAAHHRAYVLNASAAWIRVFNIVALATGQFIRANSEDVSVAWRGDGIVSNVGRFLLYATKTHTTADLGDLLREYSFNVSTGVADSGTVLGTWSSAYNINQAAGTRRGMIYSLGTSIYLWAAVVGAGVPQFLAIKLTSGIYGTPTTVNKAGYVSSIALSSFFKIDPSVNPNTYWTTNYTDNRLTFAFAGIGSGSTPRMFREVSMTWATTTAANASSTLDLVPRPTDSAYYGNGGPIGIYGGDNRRNASALNHFNFVTLYGPPANTLSTTLVRQVRFVSEDTFDAPTGTAPTSVEPTDRPTYRVRVENTNLEPNLYGKIQVNVASDTLFTTNLKVITEPDINLRYFGSKDGLSGSVTQVAVPTSGSSTALVQGTWYWRARVVSDKGTFGAWSATIPFSVSHPPLANPVYPTPASVVPFSTADLYSFAWQRSDTEPTDTQTAYRLVVTRLDTNASILDTGFVASSANSVTVSIDVDGLGAVEAPLSWTVQLKDGDGVSGPTSNPVQFTVGNTPTLAIVSPTTGVAVNTALPTVTWAFSGSGMRVQNAYRVSIYDNATPNILTNASFELGVLTGWTASNGTAAASSVQEHSGTWSALLTPSGSGVTASLQYSALAVTPDVSYTVEAWIRPTTINKNIAVGINWSTGATSLFSIAPIVGAWQHVVINAVAPVGATTGVPFAGVTGTPATGDTVYIDDVSFHATGTFTDDPIVTTGWRVGAVNSYTFTSQVLVDASSYRITVEVQDSGGLKSIDLVDILTDWIEPALASGTVVTTPDEFKVRIAWTNAAQDTDFVAYRLYRRYMKTSISAFDVDNTATTWFLLYEINDGSLTNYTFDDYLAPLNRSVEYVVVQVADRFGSLVESNITSTFTTTLSTSRYFFVPDVNIGGIASFEASGVTGDSFSKEVEQETIHVVGRGRQVQIGDDLGYSGTLTIKLRNPATARRDREFFELVSSSFNRVYVKSPFGDVVLIALGNVSADRQPGYGGNVDFADLSVPYMQIIDEALIARAV